MPDLQGELAKLKPCNPMAKGCSFLGGIGLRYSAWKETRNWTESHVSSLYASRDLRLSVGQDLTLAGDTLVLTSCGYVEIQHIQVGMQVASLDAQTGALGFKAVEAQYSNPYDEIIRVTVKDEDDGSVQTIASNRIHPYFVQTKRVVPASSEGYSYDGPLADGHWIDAGNLLPGDRLLNADGTWGRVADIGHEVAPLTAYNLTVADYHTYFVAGNPNADAVWVHNNCFDKVDFNINRLPEERQVAVNDTLQHINRGKKPDGPTGIKWGDKYKNNEGHLPKTTESGELITYSEYRVKPRPGQTGGGTDRIVVGSDGRTYYSGTHYGDNPGKPFGRIK